MSRLRVVVIAIAFAFGCKHAASDAPLQHDPPSGSSAPTTSASASTAVVQPHVSPPSLPVCAHADDPLSALCNVGADAAKARFECAKPEPILFCAGFDQWTCRYMVPFGEVVPTVTYSAAFDHVGPKIKDGQIIDTKQFTRKGPVRVVEVSTAVKTDAEGNALVDTTRATIVSWGCVERSGDVTARFDCGEWSVTVRYNDIIKKVLIDGAMRGFEECSGGA